MADTFTDMHQQLNGKADDPTVADHAHVTRRLDEWIERRGKTVEDRENILDALGIER